MALRSDFLRIGLPNPGYAQPGFKTSHPLRLSNPSSSLTSRISPPLPALKPVPDLLGGSGGIAPTLFGSFAFELGGLGGVFRSVDVEPNDSVLDIEDARDVGMLPIF